MASLIPQGFIDELLARTDIVELIDKRVPLKRAGANHQACCPFHKEKSPSFTVNADKQFYYCFGCGAGGNAVGFLMEYDNMSFPEAIEDLAHNAGMEVPREQDNNAKQKFEQHKPLLDALNKAQQFFTQQLRQHPSKTKAISYLKNRGLSGVIARDFGIGFAPPGWDNLLKNNGASQTEQKQLHLSGMLIEKDDGSFYDRFRNRICFPIKDSRGRIIGFGGRIIDPNDKPKYLNSPETPLFNKSNELYGLYEAKKANRRLQQLLVVEGYMDVISLAQMGIAYGVATLGTAIGSMHLKRLFKHTTRVCFCFDGDDAGRRAAYKALEVSLPEMDDNKDVRFLFLPDGHDPDSLVRLEGEEAFEARLSKAQPISEYLFNSAANNEPLDTVDARAKFSQRGAKLIEQLPTGNYKQLMLKELATRSGLDERNWQNLSIETETAEPPHQHIEYADEAYDDRDYAAYETDYSDTEASISAEKQIPNSGLSPAHKACILLCHNPHLIHCAAERQLPDSQDEALQVLRHIIQALQDNPSLSTGGLNGRLMKQVNEQQVSESFVRLLLGAEKLCPSSGAEAELKDLLSSIEEHQTKQQKKQQLKALYEIGIENMSNEQKQKLRQLLASKQK